jgi:hypothetical protein
MVIWLMRTARVTWIISVIQVFKFVRVVSVIKAIRVIITPNENAKEREASSECQGRLDVCNLSAHFAGKDCTYLCRRWRSHGLRRGARRRQS